MAYTCRRQACLIWPHVMCSWQAMGIPTGLLASLVACKNGVKRAHLVDARVDGGLILELYSRDGVGTMISSDFYEVQPCHCLVYLMHGTHTQTAPVSLGYCSSANGSVTDPTMCCQCQKLLSRTTVLHLL